MKLEIWWCLAVTTHPSLLVKIRGALRPSAVDDGRPRQRGRREMRADGQDYRVTRRWARARKQRSD